MNKCTEVTPGVWQWQGEADYPVVGTPCETSWDLTDLDEGHLFFNFTDVKPEDEGEDTISLHVQNDAWACMDMTLTSNDDVSSNEPELGDGDLPEDVQNIWDGELAENLQMFWWADDGDNVYEVGENTISGGVQTLVNLASTTGAFSVTLADSLNNAWGTPGPIPAEEDSFLAKAWCYGTLVPTPVTQDEFGKLGTNGPQARGTGFTCDGEALDNTTQTDSTMLDISFRTEQARHNENFVCRVPEDGTITVTKVIVGGPLVGNPEAFSFVVDAQSATPFEVDGTNVVPVTAGVHDVVEPPVDEYTATYENSENESANCDNLLVPENGNVNCTITNTFAPRTGTLTINKIVVGGPGATSSFSYQINGGSAVSFESDGSNLAVLTPGIYDVTEPQAESYSTTYANSANGSTNCTDLEVVAGQNVSCTITNTYAPACDAAIDLMIVMDNSGSINDAEEDIMQAGAVSFVNALGVGATTSHAGLASFATGASLSQSLTGSKPTIIAAINAPFTGGSTNLSAGIDVAVAELAGANDRPAIPDTMVIITDGNPNLPTDEVTAQAAALASANIAKGAGITVYVVGVGNDVNGAYLATIASPGGYYSAAQFSDVELALLTIANCGEVPTTITIQKNVVGGNALPSDFSFAIDGNPVLIGLTVVSPGAHTVSETGGPANYVSAFSGACDVDGDITAIEGANATCSITNTYVPPPPQVLFTSSFGSTGVNDVPDWTDGEATATVAVTVTSTTTGQDLTSPDGGAHVRLMNAGSICRAVPAGYNTLSLKYYFKGDPEGEPSDNGLVQYATSGTCATATFITSATHSLDNPNNGIDEGWSSLQSLGIPNNATLIRILNNSNSADEHFRVDGLELTGTPI